jgi:hypothetical protein
MGVEAIITRLCTQIAVYWGSPTSDGEGGYDYAQPKEIFCRWQDISQLVVGTNEETITSMAMVYVLEDLEQDGMLYLGTLDDLESQYIIDTGDAIPNPKEIKGAYAIKRFEKVPALGSSTEFLRKAFLTFRVGMGAF